jgi:hypothetical protein
MIDFRKKTDLDIRGKYVQLNIDICNNRQKYAQFHIYSMARCQQGGRMYDLWESLLIESELESQVDTYI